MLAESLGREGDGCGLAEPIIDVTSEIPRILRAGAIPLEKLRDVVPDIPRVIEEILTAGLERDPIHRPTAAVMASALDRWCEAQDVVASPDRLQEHLATIFPSHFQSATCSGEQTRFSAFNGRLRRQRSPNRGFWERLFVKG